MTIFSIILSAFLITIILHMTAIKLFPRLHLLDNPERYGLKRKPLPYPTGIISIIVFLILFPIIRESFTGQDIELLMCVVLLALVSVADDLKGLPAWFRLLIQILIGFLLFSTGTRIYTVTNPFGGLINLDTVDIITNTFGALPLWSGIFTILWLMLTMNAFNWFDGIPGQVSILSVIGALTLGFLSLNSRVDQPEIAAIAFLMAGIALGSALFDAPPNRVVMGDTGAMFFGLMLGTLSIYSGGKVATAFLVLGLPLVDSMIVIVTRIIKGVSPFRAHRSDEHLHHKLRNAGWSERQIILLTIVLGSAFGITALFLSTPQKFIAILLLIGVILLLTQYTHQTPARKD